MLQPTCIRISNFDLSAKPAAYLAPVVKDQDQAKDQTQYEMKPVEVRISHPLIIDSNWQSSCEVDDEDMAGSQLRSELKRLFPQDAHLRKLLFPLVNGEAMTERRRLELEACLKYPHVLDLQEAFVKKELGEELTEFEQLLLRRMDGAVDFDVLQQD